MTDNQEHNTSSPSDGQVTTRGHPEMSIQSQVFVALEPDKARDVLQATYNRKAKYYHQMSRKSNY